MLHFPRATRRSFAVMYVPRLRNGDSARPVSVAHMVRFCASAVKTAVASAGRKTGVASGRILLI